MSLETKKVLEMLTSGQITAGDAEKLLEKLGASSPAPATPTASEEATGTAQKPRFLRIVVDKPASDDQVNIRVPLAMLGSGIKLLAMLPPKVSERLAEKGIDLSNLRSLPPEEKLELLRNLHVDVDSKNGEKIRIFCE
jgi:hypothetical protein